MAALLLLVHTAHTKLARLLALLRFRASLVRVSLRMRPIAGASGEEDEEKEEETEEEDDAEKEEKEEKTEDEEKPSGEPDWKRMARKHEREAKRARKERDDLDKKLKERADADQTEQEKALEEARKSTREELEGKHQQERRQDRLEVATTKLAARGLKIGKGDDAKTVRFADPDDALVHLERDIRNGDLDADDIFDDNGRVKTDALADALTDLLDRKPHLAAEGKKKVDGSADARKGSAAKEDSTVEDHLKKIRRHKQAA